MSSSHRPPNRYHASVRRPNRTVASRRPISCLAQSLLLIGLTVLLLFFMGIIASSTVYAYYALTLPPAEELSARRSLFMSTKIYDRHGQLLYEAFDANAGRRTIVPIDEMPDYLLQATVATEDKTFYSNPGFDPLAIARSLWLNLTEGEIVSGASTITQQLVKNIFLSPEQTYTRKIQEAVLAQEITRRYSKDQILEIYLNTVDWGKDILGVEAASKTYFHRSSASISASQAAFLVAILPNPHRWSPIHPNPQVLGRQKRILRDMKKMPLVP